MPLTLTAAADDDGRRLDRILRKALRKTPLSAIHRLLRKGFVRVDGKTASQDYRVKAGETISIALDAAASEAPPVKKCPAGSSAKQAEKPAILFEGQGLLILNKTAGLAVHGKDSLETIVRAYLEPKLPPSLSFRPGPLHRLDRMSSGLIVFSANIEGARTFSSLMRERKVKKLYLALVSGVIKNEEYWQDELIRDTGLKKTFTAAPAGKRCPASAANAGRARSAVTRITPLAENAECTLVMAEIETGRTHQIRAQAACRGHPLAYDEKYGGPPLAEKLPAGPAASGSPSPRPRFFLHAWRMEFPEAAFGRPAPFTFEAPLPDNFRAAIRELFGQDFRLPAVVST